MTWFDYTIIGILGFSILISFFRGFLKEAISLITWGAAILLALKFAKPLSGFLHQHIHSEMASYAVSFVGIFIGVWLVGTIFSFMLRMVVDRTVIISGVDRVLGAGFGALRGLLVVAVVMMFINASAMQTASWYESAILPVHFQALVTWLDGFLPSHLQHVTAWMGEDKHEQQLAAFHQHKSITQPTQTR